MLLQVCAAPFVEASAMETGTYDVQSGSTTDENTTYESTADESTTEDTEALTQGFNGDKDSDTLELQTDSAEGQTDMNKSEFQTNSSDAEASTVDSSITGVKVYSIASDGTLGTELSASKYTVDADIQ